MAIKGAIIRSDPPLARPAGLAKTISEVGANFFQLCFGEKKKTGPNNKKVKKKKKTVSSLTPNGEFLAK